jgi:ribosomal protein L37AE/L43A
MTLTDAAGLLHELRERRVEVEVVGDRLRFRPVDAVPADLREQLGSHKSAIVALLHEEAFATDAGDGEKPSIERCRDCGERDFVRPRAGGAWRCVRCRPYDLPGTDVQWWPRVEMAVPFGSWMLDSRACPPGAPDARRTPRPCSCCGGTSLWRLLPDGFWTCSRCHPPAPPAELIETVTVGEASP